MSKQLRIVALALGIVAVWWILWRTIDSGGPAAPDGPSSARTEPSVLIEDDATDPASSPDLTVDPREPLHSSVAPDSSEPVVVESLPEPGLRLFGSITCESSQSTIRSPSVRLVDSGWEARITHADETGLYAFEDLRAGSWELLVQAPGYRELRRSIELTQEEPEHRLDLVLTPGDIVKVKLLGQPRLELTGIPWRARSGEASARLEPIVTLEEPAFWVPPDADARGADVGIFVERRTLSRTNAERVKEIEDEDEDEAPRLRVRFPDGSTVHDLAPPYCGVFVLSKPLPVHASLVLGDFAVETRVVPPGADEVTFELSKEVVEKLTGEVRLRVVDGDTDALPAWVNINLGQRLAGRRGSRREPDGSVVFEEVLAGAVMLTISAEGREIVAEQVLVKPGTTTDLGLYRLQPFSLIHARVVDDAGEPARVQFNVFPLDRYPATREALCKRFFRSNEGGELKIDSVGRGRYLILANDPEWISMPALADTTLGDRKDVEIRVSKGTPVAVRLRADPLPAARLEIRTREGLPVAERRCRDRDPMRFMLVPGTYSVELWDGETWLASETLVVGTEPVRIYFPR